MNLGKNVKNVMKDYHHKTQDMSPFVSLSIMFDFKHILSPKYPDDIESISNANDNNLDEPTKNNGMTRYIPNAL